MTKFNFNKNFKSLGFKDMHQEQINTLMELMNIATANAGALDGILKTSSKDSYLRAIEDKINDALIVFGGSGVTVQEDDLP